MTAPRLSAAGRLRQVFDTLSRDQQWLFLAFMLWGFGLGLWFNLQPLYLAHLGADPAQIGAVLSAGGLAVVVFYIPVGYLTDRLSQKWILFAGFVIGTAATVLIALAPDWRWTIPGFILYLTASLSRPAESALITAVDKGQNISRSFALLSAGHGFGSLLSPALGGWIAAQFGFRAVLLCAAAAYALATLAMSRMRDVRSAPPAAVAVDSGVRPAGLLRDRAFIWQLAVLMLMFFAIDVGLILSPNYLQEVKGLSLPQIGQFGTVAALGTFGFMLLLGYLRAERRRSLLLNQVGVVACLVLLLVAPAAGGVALLSPVLVLAALLRGADKSTWPVTRGRFSLFLQPPVRSLGFGFLETVSQAALTLSPLVAGQLYAHDAALPIYFGLGLLAVSGLLTLTLPRLRVGAALAAAAAPAEVGEIAESA
jgi:MFS family permease